MIYLILIFVVLLLFILFGFILAVQQYKIQKRMFKNGESFIPDNQYLMKRIENN